MVACDVGDLMKAGLVGGDIHMLEWVNKREQCGDPCLMTLSNMAHVVSCICVSKDGHYFACGSDDCAIRLYDMNTGKVSILYTTLNLLSSVFKDEHLLHNSLNSLHSVL